MKSRKVPPTETERTARVITRCYSRPTLELAAAALGAPLSRDDDIFQALVAAGIATDFNHAVLMLATHLDGSTHEPSFDDPGTGENDDRYR